MNKIIKLNTIHEIDIMLSSLTKLQYDSILLKINDFKKSKIDSELCDFNINISDIEAIGDSHVSEQFLRNYIPYKLIHPNSKYSSAIYSDIRPTTSAKCFALQNIDYTKTVIHHDCLSSWNCILDIIGRPQYLMLFKQKSNAV